MTFEFLEELIRRYLSTGIAVVVILVGPGTGTEDTDAAGAAGVTVVEPGPSGSRPGQTDRAGDSADRGSPGSGGSGSGSRTGSSDRDAPGPAGSDTGSDREPPTSGTGTSPPSSRSGTPPSSRSGTPPTSRSGTPPTSGTGPTPDAPSRRSEPGTDTGDSATRGADRADADGTDPDTDPAAGSASSGESAADDTAGESAGGSPPTERDPNRDDSTEPADRRSTDTTPSTPGDAAANTSPTTPGGTTTDATPSTDPGGTDPESSSSTGEGTTAAERHEWGTPDREDDFSGGTDQWDVYDGPGHDGQGTRSASAISLENGVLTITGDSSGTTAGMAWNPGQMYGRWEGRVRAPASDPSYNALLLLWPDADDFPVGGEIDFMEMQDPDRQRTDLFIHYGEDNSQVNGQVEVDATEWHNWAVEWTPEAITAYVDGEEWYRTTDTDIFPPGPMHLCLQLDWFPAGETTEESIMQVDWVRQYSYEGDAASTDRREAGAGQDDEGSGAEPSSSEEDGENAEESPVQEAVRRMFTWR